jgi:hypothetical protein
MAAQTDQTITDLKNRGYRIVGELDELRPMPREDGRPPDQVEQAEVLETALDALAVLTERHATAWWHRKKPDVSGAGRENLRSRARGWVFRSQRTAADLADRNKAAATALGIVLRRRGHAPTRSTGRR